MSIGNAEFGSDAGLFACMYQAIYDPKINEEVRNEYGVVLADFKLTPEVKQVAILVSGSNDLATFGQLLDLLGSELLTNQVDIYNRIRRTPDV